MKTFHAFTGIGLALVVVGCGGGAATSGDATASSSPAAAPAASSKVVPHAKLEEFMPSVTGWTRETPPKGETDAEQGVSRVQADYAQPGGMGGMSLEIMDVSTNASMLEPMRQALRIQGVEKTNTGTKKATTVAGFPATEEWTPEPGNGVVSVLVADRFAVTATGSSVGDVSAIYKFLESVDLKKMSALK